MGDSRALPGSQPDSRRLYHLAERIPRGSDLDHGRTRFDRTGADLGTGQVHQHVALPAHRLLGPPHVIEHPGPRSLVVVGAVDAHAVHAVLDQAMDQRVVVCGFAWQGHHNGHATFGGNRAEQRSGMRIQQALPGIEIDRGRV